MTLTGTLNDFEGDVARINNEPKKMLPAAAKWCNDRLKKGMTIDYDLVEDGEKKGWIAKLWERKVPVTDIASDAVEKAKEKMAKAGFGQPSGESKETCTSSGTPADAGLKPEVRSGPKKIDGEIININPEKRNLALRSLDEKGYEITTLFVWRENRDLDQAAIKQKPGWYVTVTYEAQGEVNHAQDIKYCDRPASMKKKTGYSGGSGKPYTPRNEKPIIYQVCFKEACETVRCLVEKGDFEQVNDLTKAMNAMMDIALERAKKDAKALIEAAGCQ